MTMRKLALLLLVAPLALVACGSSSPRVTADPVAYVKRAANRTVGTTEHIAMTGTMTAAGQPGSLKLSMSGDLGSFPLRGNFQLAMKAPGSNVKISEVFDGKTLYLHSPGERAPGGKAWMKVDLAALSKSAHVDFLQSMSQSPALALEQLKAAGKVSQVGAETIDGVQTTHFQIADIDVSKLAKGVMLANPNQVKFGAIDVWVGNDNGYVYREKVPLTVTIGNQTGTMTMQVDLSHFGEAVHANVPSAKETVDMTKLIKEHAAS